MPVNNEWASDVLAAVSKLANSPSNTWNQAANYAGLPAPSTCGGSTWLVLQGTGVWPFNNPSGWYNSDGAAWIYLGAYNPIVDGGNVVVTNFPAVQAVSGPLTDAQLRATPVTVEGDLSLSGSIDVGNFPAVQPVSGTVAVSNFPATQPVSGTFWPVTQPVSGTFWQATQPVSGPLTDVQLRATPVPVSGTFFQATQPISGAVTVSNFPGTQPVSGTFWQATQPVSGTFWQATQPVSLASVPLPSGAATEATLALIKAKTDNIDVALSTRTKPADTQIISGAVSVSNFPATQPVSGPLTDVQLRALAVPVSGTFWPVTQPVSGTFWQATQPVSGTFWQATQPVSGTFFQATQPVSVPTLTKGTQGTNGLPVQNLKDAGRTYISFTASAAAGVTSEALVSFNKNAQGVNTAGVTSYTVTSGKTLRITSISISVKSAAAAIAFAKLILRHNTAGATVATSPIAYLCPEINTNSAVLGTSAFITIPIPDGIEFFGNGTQTIGVSHLDQATTNILNITVHGFEY